MPQKKTSKQLIPILRAALDALITHPVILIPFITIAFVQLSVLEILYFSPRSPLSAFFNPIIRTIWGEKFIHYPNNFVILSRLFQYAQIPIYILITSFFIAVAIAIIAAINDGRKPRFLSTCWSVVPQYVHIFVGALILFCVFYGLHKAYNLMFIRAVQISSVKGIFFIIKVIVIKGASYFNLLIGVFVTAIFAFLVPLIVIEKKKIFPAIGLNFKHLWGSFWFVFALVFLPTILYVPVLLMHTNIAAIAQTTFPEMRVLALVIGILVAMFIDATVYTAITTYYLLKKEQL